MKNGTTDNLKKDSHHSKKGCVDKLKKMSDYVDGELDNGAVKSFDDHLVNCPPCLMVLKSLRKTLELFKSDKTPKLPEDMANEVKKNVMEKVEGGR